MDKNTQKSKETNPLDFFVSAMQYVEEDLKPSEEVLAKIQENFVSLGRQAIDSGLFTAEDLAKKEKVLGAKTSKSFVPGRLNLVKQVSSLPDFFKQLISPSKTEVSSDFAEEIPNYESMSPELKQIARESYFKKQKEGQIDNSREFVSSPKPKEKLVEEQPLNKEKLKRFGTDQALIPAGNYLDFPLVEDPFGNKFMVKEENGEKVYEAFTWGDSPESKYSQIVQDHNFSFFENIDPNSKEITTMTPKVEREVVDKIGNTPPVAENEDFRVYKLDDATPINTLEERLKVENIKRAAFNLPPLDKAPEWLTKETNPNEELPVLIVEQKSTGEKKLISGVNPVGQQIRHSREIFAGKESDYTNRFKSVNEIEKGDQRMPFQTAEARNTLLAQNAPREVLDSLGISPEGQQAFRSTFIGFTDGSILDTGNLIYDLIDQDKKAQVKPQIQVTPYKSEGTSRFNPVAQLGALGQLLAGKSYEQDIGRKDDLPVGEELKKIEEKVKTNVEPATFRVTTPLGETSQRDSLRYENGKLIKKTDVREKAIRGSGFHIGNGVFITAKHVISDSIGKEIDIVSNQGQKHKAEVLYMDPTYDYAILRADTAKSAKALPLGSSTQREEATKTGRQFLVTAGYPGGEPPFASERGVLSRTGEEMASQVGYEKTQRPFKTDEFSSKFYGGQSGGSVLDRYGNVVGIISIPLDNPDYPGYQGGFVAIDVIKDKLKELGVK